MSSTYIELPQSGGSSMSGVDSFNGRVGTVVSVSGDYSATQITYSNIVSGIPAANVQAAIDYLANIANTSASPGFSFGRAGVVAAGTYLQCETVPSNVSGRWVYINSAKVVRVFVSNEISGTFDIQVYYHDGNSINLTSLGTVSVSAAYGGAFVVNWSVPTNKQIAVKVATNSAKNIVCGLELTGTNL